MQRHFSSNPSLKNRGNSAHGRNSGLGGFKTVDQLSERDRAVKFPFNESESLTEGKCRLLVEDRKAPPTIPSPTAAHQSFSSSKKKLVDELDEEESHRLKDVLGMADASQMYYRQAVLGQFSQVGQLKGVSGRQMLPCSKQNQPYLRSFSVTEPKYWPEAVQVLTDLIYPATAAIPVYGFDPADKKRRGSTPWNPNFEFFLPSEHLQTCDICNQSLIYSENGIDDLHIHGGSIHPSDFGDLIPGYLKACPCNSFIMCMQNSSGVGCYHKFRAAQQEIFQELHKLIHSQKNKSEGLKQAYRELENQIMWTLSSEDHRVLYQFFEGVAWVNKKEKKDHDDYAIHFLEFCRKILRKHLEPSGRARARDILSKFHRCQKCEFCYCHALKKERMRREKLRDA